MYSSIRTVVWYYLIISSIITINILWLSYADLWLLFDLPQSLQWWTFPVSFIWWWNSYAWSLIFNNQTSVNKTIQFDSDGTSITCKRQIHWYYFNTARWVGLLPLSSQTYMNDWLTVNGWVYTSCGHGARLYDIVWILEYQKTWASLWTVVFGVETDEMTNSSNGRYQAGALSWKISNGVNGRFFDTMFGIGTITSTNNWTEEIGNVSSLIGTFTNIYVQWHIWIWQSVDPSEREILTVNLAGTKTLLTSTDEILSADVINSVSKNTAKQCRTTDAYTVANANAGQLGWKKFICIDVAWGSFTIDSNNIWYLANKDIVFLHGDVILDHSMYKSTNYTNYLSIYIPDWNLIFESDISSNDMSEIDNNWFLVTTNTSSTQWVYIVGNFIVNGLIVWSNYNSQTYKSIPFKTFIHGKLISLNTFTTVSAKREKLLEKLLQSRWHTFGMLKNTPNEYFINNQWSASMGDIFSWRCDDTNNNGVWALPIGTFTVSTINAITQTPCPPGHRYPLAIIEKKLPTLFFRK
jgi:hypothetical protein